MKHVNHLWLILIILISPFFANAGGIVNYTVSGLEDNDKAVVSISSNEYLITSSVTNGNGSFSNIPEGKHALKIEATGYNIPASKIIIVDDQGNVSPNITIELIVTKISNNENEWTHSWASDGSTSGYSTTTYINNPPQVDFLGKKIVPADVPSMSILLDSYNIILSDDGEAWTQEYAYRLLETLKTIPCYIDDNLSKFTLTSEALANDIKITKLTGGKEVTISKDAFYYANPFLVNLDGVKGRFFSKRLHHAMVNYLTDFGEDSDKANEILRNRFGCEVKNVNYEELTAGITNEDASHFQEFNPTELVSIINMFEEMPEGFHKTPHLNYLIRRLNGHDHPIYPSAAAVSWTTNNGYIEFMEKTFGGSNEGFETLRLILHEKTHFLWAFSFSDKIKNDWIELGGWYQDPNAPSGWSTSKTTEFVSAYAHAHNPDEDMAESVAHYIKNPELLQSRSLPKYEFIRDHIMHGTRYISSIPEHLTFEVLNLNPDYDYPGKIKRLEIKASGAPYENKKVIVEIELNHIDGFADGASKAITRITSPEFIDKDGVKRSQYYDLHLTPIDGNEHILRGEFEISKYCKSGYWTASDIVVTDKNENQRFEGRNDYVWNLYINNSLEDIEAPKYVSGSLDYKVTEIEIEGHKAKNLQVSFKVTDNIGLREHCPVVIRLCSDKSQYSWGDMFGEYNPNTQIATVNYTITEFYPDAEYYVTFLSIYDKAETCTDIYFSNSPDHEQIKKIYISNANPDYEAPEIDLNRISVYAEPTNPEAPDGETLVTINYYARDNKSGLGKVYYNLKDPQGSQFSEYHYHRNFYNTYFDGDPTVWERYTINCVLPRGSVPGIWGLASMEVNDKAFNGKIYNFVETLIFEPDNSTTDYVLFSELENNILTIGLTSEQANGYGFTYRIIHEESGKEINGSVDVSSHIENLCSVPKMNATVDVSSLEDGRLIVIATIKDTEGNIIAVRSTSLLKNSLTRINTIKYNNGIKIITENELLTIYNPNSAEEVISIYSISGQLVSHNKVYAEKTTISLQRGMYIVKVGNKSFKVIL